jgi:hypothetical protein
VISFVEDMLASLEEALILKKSNCSCASKYYRVYPSGYFKKIWPRKEDLAVEKI